MTLILILLVGGIIGWLASILMRTDAQQGIFLNIVVGVIGALIAGVVITPLIGGAPITSGAFDIMSLFASFLGAVILLAIVNLFRRGSIR
ncbi:putative membrane protein YeaQ/YmgE (transglycosylase-associated protein family) [Novosphingobium fluoreni]|uniref:Putative membrane protein YeaQ/YmgE (Transglycosylase-associated protein family) n=1 Tax=Novosphingobium fluoreni TaxID=1391222 RepID=A0A7W6C4N3_9SPHN|nr:GlsB/YeaQ/YmgE family stress response membrane protein [Novosphingobium fluoreni]KTR81845.1 transglycosylase [Novosphingobium barchaimii]MBB3939461.1 putative membrane protein YeaQ/YmgE (transglycosylase-associated protein family) [Novosphingobium fluoreni]